MTSHFSTVMAFALSMREYYGHSAFVVHCRKDIEFVTDSSSHNSRTWIIRIVHPASVHDKLLASAKKWHDDHAEMRFLMLGTSAVEADNKKDTQVSYIAMWCKNAIRQASLLRMVTLWVDGLDSNIHACRKEIAHLMCYARGYGYANERIEATKELEERRKVAAAIKSGLSFALLDSAQFWRVVNAQLEQDDQGTCREPCDVVVGKPCRKKLPVRENASLHRAVRESKRQRLEIGHRPVDAEARAREEYEKRRLRTQLMYLEAGHFVQLSISYERFGRRVEQTVEAEILERFQEPSNDWYYRVQYVFRNITRVEKVFVDSPSIIDLVYETDSSSDSGDSDSDDGSGSDSGDDSGSDNDAGDANESTA
jgi:hypothetical protein